jgi:hypothetical protein
VFTARQVVKISRIYNNPLFPSLHLKKEGKMVKESRGQKQV